MNRISGLYVLRPYGKVEGGAGELEGTSCFNLYLSPLRQLDHPVLE
jgi:hypothetical protein